ncbi:DUF2071 domain-containing protein [Alkalihalophilus pseudofirmus]|uniref:DUF2071 domain-containing protein n=1 Tax=Alkalihalophilus pseudofirmus TaxID=79885 RepID=UPI0009FAB81D
MLSKSQKSLVKMKWENVLFAHWTYDPHIIQAKLPKGIKVDTYKGKAYVGVVSFLMNKIHPKIFPEKVSFSLPEINVRTYVEVDGKKGVLFLSLDTDSKISVLGANAFFDMPYFHSDITMKREGDLTYFESIRKANQAVFKGAYSSKSDIFAAREESLEYWLTERYRLYSTAKNGDIQYGDIKHEQWPLQLAGVNIKENSLILAAGLPSQKGEPHLLYSPGVTVDIGMIQKF